MVKFDARNILLLKQKKIGFNFSTSDISVGLITFLPFQGRLYIVLALYVRTYCLKPRKYIVLVLNLSYKANVTITESNPCLMLMNCDF